MPNNPAIPTTSSTVNQRFMSIILVICAGHFINDALQSLLPSIYPILHDKYALSFLQVGLITATFQVTGSLLQPIIGFYGDKNPMPSALPISFVFSLLGILTLAFGKSYSWFLLGSALLGLGSSLFHPESARVTRAASGGRYGFAQSIFQIGGNSGTAIGPLIAALFISRQQQLMWIAPFAIVGAFLLRYVSNWYIQRLKQQTQRTSALATHSLSKSAVTTGLAILIALMFAKYVYLSTFQNYYTLYVIERFSLTVRQAQLMLFLFLSGVALGTIFGGPIGDKIGARAVIWVSILGVLPFTLILPFVGLVSTAVLSVIIGAILASAFPAIVVYAQELIPGKVGTIGGAMYGLSFGIAALSSCAMGYIGDYIGLHKLFIVCSFLPILGVLAIFLPNFEAPCEPS